jgi:hypothetical protein
MGKTLEDIKYSKYFIHCDFKTDIVTGEDVVVNEEFTFLGNKHLIDYHDQSVAC